MNFQGIKNSSEFSSLFLDSKFKNKNALIILDNENEFDEYKKNIQFFCGTKREVKIFPSWDNLPFEYGHLDQEISSNKINCLSNNNESIILSSLKALKQKIIAPTLFNKLKIFISKNQTINKLEFNKNLLNLGYKQTRLVSSPSQVAIRGIVTDIYIPIFPKPFRIEFFKDTVKSINIFDPKTQKNIKKINELNIFLGSFEINLNYDQQIFDKTIKTIKKTGIKQDIPKTEIEFYENVLKFYEKIPGTFQLNSFSGIYDSTLLNYLPKTCHIFYIDRLKSINRIDKYQEQIELRAKNSINLISETNDQFIENESLFTNLNQFSHSLINPLSFPTNARKINYTSLTEFNLKLKSKQNENKSYLELTNFIKKHLKENFTINFSAATKKRAENIQKIFTEFNIDSKILNSLQEIKKNKINIVIGNLSTGFINKVAKEIFISETDIFSSKLKLTNTNLTEQKIKKILASISELKTNDYIIHNDYGIAKYLGLKHLKLNGFIGDVIELEYEDSKLILPIYNIGKINKHSVPEGSNVKLNKLGNSSWNQTKLKIKKSAISLAGELINLYAARKTVSGHRYDFQGAIDEEFSQSFPYSETDDQINAINNILSDLSKPKPMDRLICGDVGFGKTEVAIRGAYKVLQHAKQVAILAPTTILVEQHKNTLINRFKDFPYEIRALSRFYKPKQNKETLELIEDGKIDIVVGTHKLLSDSIKFKDLGLLIIDEEHRFGVKQKEKITRLKKDIDILSLTATPIPRTLHQSLLNVRDISVIATPPTNRKLIRTYTAKYEDTLIIEAITRETDRDGQVFFINNRINNIEFITNELKELLPNIKFEFAHGRMKETELEAIMKRFLNKEIDCLIATTILESGIDIPNANTIIINNANSFGLAQLYQLRGRVGRSNKQAYCYFLIPKNIKDLNIDSKKRLKALAAIDDLGHGFNLAIRDLEIRGTGNLLGKEQSGNINNIGYDLYTKILNEAISRLKGTEVSITDQIEPEIKIKADAFLNEDYIVDIAERLSYYQRLSVLKSIDEYENIKNEICQLYGSTIPKESFNLLQIMKLKFLLKINYVINFEESENLFRLKFHKDVKINEEYFKIYKNYNKYGENGIKISNLDSFENNPSLLYKFFEEFLEKIV